MAPHHALLISEVLREIFERLADVDGRDRHSLTQCALTCKDFSELALDVLWRELDSLFPLLQLTGALQLAQGCSSLYVFRGAITCEDWHLFDRYARRVRSFCCMGQTKTTVPRIHESAYFRIAHLRSGTHFLPCLEILHWSPWAFEPLLFFLSPTLRQVHLWEAEDEDDMNEEADDTIGTFLSLLAREAPPLQHLSSDFVLPWDVVHCFLPFPHLRVLSIEQSGRGVDRGVLDAFRALENLSELTLDLDETPLTTDDYSRMDGFKSLTCLTLQAKSSLLAKIMSTFASAELERVSFWVGGAGRTKLIKSVSVLKFIMKKLRACLYTLVSNHSTSLWSVLILGVGPHDDPYSTMFSDEVSTISVLHPLLSVRQLLNVTFMQTQCLSLSDEDIHEMAVAWPKLFQFHVPFSSGRIQPTFKAMLSLAQLCPSLKTLHMNCDCRGDSVAEPTTSLPHYDLETWEVGPSQIDDSTFCSRHLTTMFPCLREISVPWPDWEQTWTEVSETLHQQIVDPNSIRYKAAFDVWENHTWRHFVRIVETIESAESV